MAWAAMVVAMLLWASSFVASKWALEDLSPEQAVGLRLIVAAAVTLPYLLIWGRRHLRSMTASHWKWLLALSLFEPCLYFLAEMNGLLYTSASAASLVTATLPIWVALGAWLVLKEQVSSQMWCGIVLAFAGTAALSVFGAPSETAPNPLLGNSLMVLAMLCACGYILIAKKLTASLDPWLITVLQIWIGMVFFMPFLLASPPDLAAVTPQGFWSTIWLGVVVSLGAYGFYNYAISQVPAQLAGMSINLIPLFSLVMAGVLLGERLSGAEMLAALCILAGVFVALWPRRSIPQQIA